MSKTDKLVATCQGLGINLDPEIFEVNENDTVTLKHEISKDGVGISNITGSINAANHLTIIFTLTDGTTKTVEGDITPSPTV